MKEFISNEALEEKYTIYQKLKTAKQKIAFWQEELRKNYLDFLENINADEYRPFWPFQIGQEVGKEREELNKWILEATPQVYPRYKIIEFKILKRELNKQLVVTREKRKILLAEKRKIDSSFQDVSKSGGIFQRCGSFYINNLFPAEYNAYRHSLEDNEEPDYSKEYPTLNIYQVHNGYVLGQYRRFIQEEIDKLDSSKVETTSLDIDQVALLLDLVGVLDGMDCDTTDKARIFCGILKVNEKDLYDAMRTVRGREIKNKENIQEVLLYLEEQEVKGFKKDIQKEYEKLNK